MLKGKRAIVTGSTSGIGLAIATGFAAEGADVMLNGFGDSGEIERRRAGLAAEHGVRVAYNGADMTKPEQIRDLVAATAREFGGVDILVNNAGIQHVAHGLVASGEKAAYVTAKHGLVGLTKVIAIEAANDGVTCNAICPGWVLTPLVRAQIEARAKAQGIGAEKAREDLISEKQPMLEFTTPEKIAALAVFLCGDGASTMTGAALSIDGGWVAQ